MNAADMREIALRTTQDFFALVMMADGEGVVIPELDCGQCRATLDVLEGLGLIEVGGERVRVIDVEIYDKGDLRRLADQLVGVMRERV